MEGGKILGFGILKTAYIYTMSKQKTIEPKQPTRNPRIQADFTNKQATLDFYNSFDCWGFYICMGDCKKPELVEVKDGLVFQNGEYYLPAPASQYSNTYGKAEKLEDGK